MSLYWFSTLLSSIVTHDDMITYLNIKKYDDAHRDLVTPENSSCVTSPCLKSPDLYEFIFIQL